MEKIARLLGGAESAESCHVSGCHVFFQDDGKGGLSSRGVAFMTVLAVLENTLPLLCWPYKMQDKEATVTVLTVLAVMAVVAVSVVTATPLKLNPPFPSSWFFVGPICQADRKGAFVGTLFSRTLKQPGRT